MVKKAAADAMKEGKVSVASGRGAFCASRAVPERGTKPRPSSVLSVPCERVENAILWVLERVLKLPGAAEEEPFFGTGYPADSLEFRCH